MTVTAQDAVEALRETARQLSETFTPDPGATDAELTGAEPTRPTASVRCCVP